MKVSTLLALALSSFAAVTEAHSIFQKISVNDVDQGQLKGVRAPDSTDPIEDVNHQDFACNTGIQHKDNTIIDIPAGAKVGTWWGYGTEPSAWKEKDHPIAESHKGPVLVYLAKVDNAATAGTSGLKWFKIFEDGFNPATKQWAVDTLIANSGWTYFKMPTCIAPGNYLMRVEIIALHSAFPEPGKNGAQFYMECAQINVKGSGSNTGSANSVSFPGGYQADHPGIKVSIYGEGGQPDNGGRTYSIPGPPVLQCSGTDNGTGNGKPVAPSDSAVKPEQPDSSQTNGSEPEGSQPDEAQLDAPEPEKEPESGEYQQENPEPEQPQPEQTQPEKPQPPQPQSNGGSVPKYQQCGGKEHTGATECASGSTCEVINEWYSQCI